MQPKAYPWSLETVTDIKARAVMVRDALTKELEARGIEPPHAMPFIHEAGWGAQAEALLLAVVSLTTIGLRLAIEEQYAAGTLGERRAV